MNTQPTKNDMVAAYVRGRAMSEIEKLLKGEVTSVELEGIRPGDILEILKMLGITEDKHFETDHNGWQWDYWIDFFIQGKTYVLAGDGFYKHTCTFSLKTQEDEEE